MTNARHWELNTDAARKQMAQHSDQNMLQALRHFTRFTPGGHLIEDSQLLLAASSHSYIGPMHNAAVRKDLNAEPHVIINRARQHFTSLGRGFVLWIRGENDTGLASAAREAGLRSRDAGLGAAGMAVRGPFRGLVTPPGVQLIEVRDTAHAEAFGIVVADAFSTRSGPQPRMATLAMFADPMVLLDESVTALIARVGDDCAACAMGLMTGEGGGIYWVSTRHEFRKRGLATYLTAKVSNACFDQGASTVVLQSSSMGEAVYRRMGFIEVTRYQRWICDPPRDQ